MPALRLTIDEEDNQMENCSTRQR